MQFVRRFAIALALLSGLAGCTPSHVILRDLQAPVPVDGAFVVGTIEDRLPSTVALEDRPRQADVDKLRLRLAEEIAESEVLSWQQVEPGFGTDYEIRGTLLDFDGGSGFARFMIGFGAGSAKITVLLELVSTWDDEVVFGGRFEGVVVSWAESGDKIFDQVARDFVRELEKSQEALAR